jgi:cytidylate kinase
MTRSVEALVDEQARRWTLARKQGAREARRPVITIARQHGALGMELARRLAEELKLDLFDREIIHRIAESSHLSERVVASLDEKNRELLTDWLAAVASRDYLSPAEYRYHLTRVVGAIAHQGGAVIIGRGGNLILGPGEALRVLVVGPLEVRVRRLMEREALSDREARRRIQEVEADQRAFLMKYFHTDFPAPESFDVMVNPIVLGLEGCVRVVTSAIAALPARRSSDALHERRPA